MITDFVKRALLRDLADGKPRVKLTTSEEASGLLLVGRTDTTHTILEADRDETSLRLRDHEARQRMLTP